MERSLNVPESAELVAQMAGTEERWEYTLQTDERAGKGRYWGDESGVGTKRRTEEFVIHPNKLKRLGVGEAVLLTKNPHGARLVAVEREKRSEELAVLEDARRRRCSRRMSAIFTVRVRMVPPPE